MFDEIVDRFLTSLYSVPPLLGSSPHTAMLIRAMVALVLIVFVVYLIAMRPFSAITARCLGKVRHWIWKP